MNAVMRLEVLMEPASRRDAKFGRDTVAVPATGESSSTPSHMQV